MKRDLKFAKKIEWEEPDKFCIGFDEMGPDWQDGIYKDKSITNVVEWVYSPSDKIGNTNIVNEQEINFANVFGYGEPAGLKSKIKKDFKSEAFPGLRS